MAKQRQTKIGRMNRTMYYNLESNTVYRIDESTAVNGISLEGFRTLFEERLSEDRTQVRIEIYQGFFNAFAKRGNLTIAYSELDSHSRQIFEEPKTRGLRDDGDVKVSYCQGKPKMVIYPSLEAIAKKMDLDMEKMFGDRR